MFYRTYHDTPLGQTLLISDGLHLVGLWLATQKHDKRFNLAEIKEDETLPIFIQTKQWLNAYFKKQNPPISALPLAPKGSGFQQMVWQILCQIPHGKILTYGDIAKEIMQKTGKATMSAQAVGGAVGRNPISIIVPCHRVIGAKSNLTGYAGGLDAKIKLLEHEGVNLNNFKLPNGKRIPVHDH